MKSITRYELAPGMILYEDVVLNNQVILKAGTKLNEVNINQLHRYSVMCVSVYEDIDFAQTHYERLRFSDEFNAFEAKHKEWLNAYKYLLEYFINAKKDLPVSAFLDIYHDLRTTYKNGSQLLDFIYNLTPNENQLTYNHCLNSALLGGIFSEWLHMNTQDTNTLILSCFFYDIGKFQLPYQILWKPGKLTDEEFDLVKKHPLLGYSLISGSNVLNSHVKNAVVMHHERMDGSGYPYHMKDDKIDIFARYISIIDTYIAMASPRTYRNAFTPLQIVEHFEQKINLYDSSLVFPLLSHIADSQIGMNVLLSDNSEWQVFIKNPGKLSRPVLKNDKNEILYLSDHPELNIIRNL